MEKQKIGLGRRKEAVTRVFLSKGDGKIVVNNHDYKVYFPQIYLQNQVDLPHLTVDGVGKYYIKLNAAGGGIKRQAEASILAIARALINLNPEFKPLLKVLSLLTRDPRGVERKKFGKKKARRSFQFSKR